jgi:hypothetical protein
MITSPSTDVRPEAAGPGLSAAPTRRDRRVARGRAQRRRGLRRLAAVSGSAALLMIGASAWSAGVRHSPERQEVASIPRPPQTVASNPELTTPAASPTSAASLSQTPTQPLAHKPNPTPLHATPAQTVPSRAANTGSALPPRTLPPAVAQYVSAAPQVTGLSCAATGSGAVLRGSAVAGTAPVTVVMSLGGRSQTRYGPAGSALSFSMSASPALVGGACSVSVASSAGQGRATAVVR